MPIINVALIGCGKFVHDVHLANLLDHPSFHIYATTDVNAEAARKLCEDAGALYWTIDSSRVFEDPAVDLVFIATPHFTHADLSLRAAQAGKHIFCEKPMALTEPDALAVYDAVTRSGVKYMCGYNRSYAPFTVKARDFLGRLSAPKQIFHRIADWNPYNQGWLLDETLSGGRLLGEAGHAVDFMCQLVGLDPVRVYAEGANLAEPSPTGAPDSATITLGFPDGSSGVLLLSSVGNNKFPKEEVQIFCAGNTINIRNFCDATFFATDDTYQFELPAVDKGHRTMLDALAHFILDGEPVLNGAKAALRTTRCTLAAVRAVRTHQLQWIA